MSGTFLEQFRLRNEEIEAIEKAVALILYEKSKNSKKLSSISYDLAVRYLIDRASISSRKSADDINDVDGLKKEELKILGGHSDSGKNELWTNFYSRINAAKAHDRKYPNLEVPQNLSARQIADEAYTYVTSSSSAATRFSTAERHGSVLDLSEHYSAFINLEKLRKFREEEYRKNIIAKLQRQLEIKHSKLQKKKASETIEESEDDENDDLEMGDNSEASPPPVLDLEDEQVKRQLEFAEIEYVEWLRTFEKFAVDPSATPRHCKYGDAAYKQYLTNLVTYLRNFFVRRNPLARTEEAMRMFAQEFADRWGANGVSGWQESLPGPTFKLEFYCWESDTLCATAGGYERHRNSAKFKKIRSKYDGNGGADIEESAKHAAEKAANQQDREIAWLECQVERLKGLLEETIESTINHVHKTQARLPNELDMDANDDADETAAANVRADGSAGLSTADLEGVEEEVDESEKPIYNPLNLPLGFDGKPIPYWLWKLNGLGHEFKCEICGNFSYWGWQNFQKHFSEWRHQMGMKCLKIPNSSHFKDITKIQDAVKLHERLRTQGANRGGLTAATGVSKEEEEFEDGDGNIMSRQLLEDLRRQGLA